MDYTLPAILFAIGFGAAIAARSVRFWMRGDAGLDKTPLEGGAVRLDLVARGARERGESAASIGVGDVHDGAMQASPADATASSPRNRRKRLSKRRIS